MDFKRLSPAFIVTSVTANLMLAGGLTGLFAPSVVPVLAGPLLAWSLLGVGTVLELMAIGGLFAAMSRPRNPAKNLP